MKKKCGRQLIIAGVLTGMLGVCCDIAQSACEAKCKKLEWFKSADNSNYYFVDDANQCRRIWICENPEDSCATGTPVQKNKKKVTVGAASCSATCNPNSGIHGQATCGSVTVQNDGTITCYPECEACGA